MYKVLMCFFIALTLCSCEKSVQGNADTSECLAYKAKMIASQPPNSTKEQHNFCKELLYVKQETKRLLISYQVDLKRGVMAAIEGSNLPIIYDLKNMNIIVVAVPEKEAERYIKYFQSLYGIYGVKEDGMMYLN